MSGFGWPEAPFNALAAPQVDLLTPLELLASPFGLVTFIPLVPLLRLTARRWPRGSIIFFSLLWLLATTGPVTTLVVLLGVSLATGWVIALGRLVAARRLSPRAMTALVWIGLSTLAMPLWWEPDWWWYGWDGSRLAPFHMVGLAYFYLRLIAWGVDLAHDPQQPLRPLDTVCWLAYAPVMRLGPVLRRQDFLARFDAWSPKRRPPWRLVAQRFGLFLAGGVLLGVVVANIPAVPAAGADYFARPERYNLEQLLGVYHLVPIHVFLALWTYHELAAALALWIGIPVDLNFNWVPTSTSVRDYWRRWNITVGAWLRDYIYIPLGGRYGPAARNYLIVFVFCGIWHGAAFSFVAWGALQAAALLVQKGWDRIRGGREAAERPGPAWWTATCWLLTMQFEIATTLVFVDFLHAGGRFFPELLRQLLARFSSAP